MSRALLVIRRRRPIGEPAALRELGSTGAFTLDGTAGAGRIVHALSEAGVRCESLIQAVVDDDLGPDQLRSIDVGRRFETIVVASHLVNLPDEARRVALLELAGRHLAKAGSVIVEHHPIDWAETADEVEPTPGSGVGMLEVRREPPFVSAVSVYDVGGRWVRQPFTARVLSETNLAEALGSAGLRLARRLSPTLIEARPGGLDMHDLRSGDAQSHERAGLGRDHQVDH